MKLKFTFLFLCIALVRISFSQAWQARQSLAPGAQRTFASVFGISGKIYVVGGNASGTGLSSVWQYDIAGDSWLQKNSFPGGVRGGAVAFSIGGKGYLACGSNYTGQYFKDVWEYDPATDTWTQKGNFPGMEREEAACFVIGNKAYVGTGYQEVVGPNSTFFITYNDFYEYTPANDSWTAKANVPGQPRGWAVGAALGNRGYMGLGSNSSQNGSYNDFYEYNPASDTWTSAANYPLPLGDAMCFADGVGIYVCGGVNFGNGASTAGMRRFDPASNSWLSMPSLGGGITMGGVAIFESNRVYAGTGYNAAFAEKADWWEYTAITITLCPSPVAYSTSAIPSGNASACNGKVVISGITNGCAPFTLSVSPASGSVSPAASGFTVSGLCAGVYSVWVTDANCCGTTMTTCTVPFSNTSGLSENTETSGTVIYPNPNNGSFVIHAGSQSAGALANRLKMISLLGEEIGFNAEVKDNSIHLSLYANRKGIYVLRDGPRVIGRVVVQ